MLYCRSQSKSAVTYWFHSWGWLDDSDCRQVVVRLFTIGMTLDVSLMDIEVTTMIESPEHGFVDAIVLITGIFQNLGLLTISFLTLLF